MNDARLEAFVDAACATFTAMLGVTPSVESCETGTGVEAGVTDAVLEAGGVTPVRDPVDVAELLVFLVAHARVDQDERIGGLDEQAA
jgi:hypothetical protein